MKFSTKKISYFLLNIFNIEIGPETCSSQMYNILCHMIENKKELSVSDSGLLHYMRELQVTFQNLQ